MSNIENKDMQNFELLLARLEDGKNNFSSYIVKTDGSLPTINQFKAAVEDYCKDMYEHGSFWHLKEDFNWKDALESLSKDDWTKHGIEPIQAESFFVKSEFPKIVLQVDSDEVLLPKDMTWTKEQSEQSFARTMKKVIEQGIQEPSEERKAEGLKNIFAALASSKGKVEDKAWEPKDADRGEKQVPKISKDTEPNR